MGRAKIVIGVLIPDDTNIIFILLFGAVAAETAFSFGLPALKKYAFSKLK